MSQLFKIGFFSLLVYLSLSGCERKDVNRVKIAVKLDSAANAELELVTFNILNMDQVSLAKTTLDSAGKGELGLSLDHPIFAFVKQGDGLTLLFLSPGNNQTVTKANQAGKTDRAIVYSGGDAIINEYLQKVQLTYSRYAIYDYRKYEEIDPEEFLTKKDSLEKEIANHFANLKKDKTVKPEILQIMKANNRIIIYSFTQSYISGKFGYDHGNPDIPANLKALIADLPQDSLALAANIYEYGLVLRNHLHLGIFSSVDDKIDSLETDVPELDYPTFLNGEIESMNYIGPVKEYLKAANINYWLGMEGLSKEVDTLWARYQKTSRNAFYKNAIKKSYDQWAALAPGKPAPDFTGTTANGKKISLSSLKGKLVYVDIWATWCGPCREEFPHSKKLMKEFEGNEKITFLYVSTDENIDAWKKLLPDRSVPAGIHINQKQEKQPDAIWDNYHLWGIPRYLLIDANGNMLKTHAPRPSSEDILPLLKGYLKES